MHLHRYMALCASIAALALLAAAPATAKDACLTTPDGSSIFVFEGYKVPKPGRSVSLRGIWIDPVGFTAPFDGSAMMRPDKQTVQAGIFVHALVSDSHNFTLEWTTTKALAGEASVDSSGDYRADRTLSLSVIDCKSVVVP